MKSTAAVVVAVFASLGCMSTIPTPAIQHPIAPYNAFPPIFKNVCIDTKAFDNEDAAQLVAALDDWRIALNGSFDYTIGGLCDWSVFLIDQPNELAPSLDMLAYTNSEGGNQVFVYRHRIHNEQKLRDVFRHEIGHLLGSGHNPKKQGLMSDTWSPQGYSHIDAWTIEQVILYQNEGVHQ